jgi:hypothetical protein
MQYVIVGDVVATVHLPDGLQLGQRKRLVSHGVVTYCIFDFHGLRIEIEQSHVRLSDGMRFLPVGVPETLLPLPIEGQHGEAVGPVERKRYTAPGSEEMSPAQENAVRAMEEA